MSLGKLDPKIGETIVAAANEVIEGKLDNHFPSPSGRRAPALSRT